LALVTLVFQALLLAHGGLTTLGANLFSLGVVGPWAMWILLRLLLRSRLDAGPLPSSFRPLWAIWQPTPPPPANWPSPILLPTAGIQRRL
jgi:hypothetical protein